MNELHKIPNERRPTQAAEGLPRWAWTLAEFDRFIELGVIGEDDRVELIGGELVPIPAKGNRHELVKTALINSIIRRLPEDIWASVELGWRPAETLYLEPDIVIFAKCPDPSALGAADALLVIEIAASSLAYDIGRKAEVYAALGLADYWVINADTLETRVHREPSQKGFGTIETFTVSETMEPLSLRDLPFNLAKLEIG